MNIISNSSYKFERKFSNKEAYHVKVTKELYEDLENNQNIDEVILNVNEKTGTLTIQSKKSSKVFNINIEPINKGEKESFELNLFRSNKIVEPVASLNVRLNVQATSKVYDMTKKKIAEVVDENKKHCAKEIKIPICPSKNGVSYPVLQNKENRKSDNSFNNQTSNKPNLSSVLNKHNQPNTNKLSQFTIREKVLHLLAPRPISKDRILFNIHRMGVSQTDRSQVDKYLHQLAILEKDLFQISNKFVIELRDDWPLYSDEDRKAVAKLKFETKSKVSNNVITDNKKLSPKSQRSNNHDTISPAESNSSSKTLTSIDEGFVSGGKRSPLKYSNNSHSVKRSSQHLSSVSTNDASVCKKMRQSDKRQSYSHNELNSSSSSNVTPNSDVSLSSSVSKSRGTASLDNRDASCHASVTTNKTTVEETQNLFNAAYEEYSKLCLQMKEHESEIERLRSLCKNSNSSEYSRILKHAKALLDQLETPEFQKLTSRVKTLESEMSVHVRILIGQHLN